MNIRNTILASVGALVLAPAAALADPVSFDFTDLGSNNTQLDYCVEVNGVVACGMDNVIPLATGVVFDEALLWLRNEGGDNGLGVCGDGTPEAEAFCRGQGGDVNEIDNIDSTEGVYLLLPELANNWTSLWVSSLDNNGGANDGEDGTLWFFDRDGFVQRFDFSYAECNIECDVLALASGALSADLFSDLIHSFAVVFTPNPDLGTDNDYLVWKGSYEVPEPATLALMGLGLLGLGASRRRKAA